MQENQKKKQILQRNNSKNGKFNKYNQHYDLEKNLHTEQFDMLSSNNALNITSTQTKKDNKQLDGEENYVSTIDFYEKQDLNSICQQMSASQLELMVFKTERQKQNSLLRLNSTINPKINLHEKQVENTKMEDYYQKRDSNLLKQQQKFSTEQLRAPQTYRIKQDFREKDSNIEDFKHNKTSKAIAQRRRSSKMQIQQFQNTLQKAIQMKNSQQEEHKGKIDENLEKEESVLTQKLETNYNNQIQDLNEKNQQEKFCNIQKLIRKEGQLSNSFVVRLGIFQRFLRNMKNLSQAYKFRTMNFEYKKRFNDLSFFQSKKKQASNARSSQKILISVFQKLFNRLINKIPIFNPLNCAVIGLKLTVLLILITSVFILPLAVSFDILILHEGIGCIFNQVAKNLNESWLTKNNINNADWYVRYINSVYFSFISMVTVGYGDITPISLQEKIFVIFMVAYSCGVFGYIVSSIGNIFTERAQIQAKFKSQLADIIQYMRTRNIDQTIQSEVYKYLDYLEKMDHYNHQKGEFTVQKLSPYLQQKIKINSYYPFLKKTNYFKLNFKDSTLISASLKIKELTFGPSQIIFNQNDYDNRLYFILKGEVQLSHNSHKICIKDEKDFCFGINEFFTGEVRGLQAQSLTVSQILYLELNDFKEILKEDPLEYEKFSSLKDQTIFSKISIDQPCYFCNKFSHTHEKCPFYTIKNQRLLIIERSKRSADQLRQKFERIYLHKFNSLQNNQVVRLNLKAVRLNFINNLAIDKCEIIQLIQNNIQIENDIDFYRYNDAFEFRKSFEGEERDEIVEQRVSIKLISTDKIAEEFFLDEEIFEKQEEAQESNIFDNSSKKIFRSSIQTIENYVEEQKNSQQFPFISSHNHQNKRSSYLINSIYQQNHIYEKHNSIKEHFSQKSIHNSSIQDQSQKKIYDSSENQNQNMINNQNFFNQILNQKEQKKEKYNSDENHDVHNKIKQDEFFKIYNFDQMQVFTRYYPKNNFYQVLQKYNKLNQKSQRFVNKKAKKCTNRNTSASINFPQNQINQQQKRIFLENAVKYKTMNISNNTKQETQGGMQNILLDLKCEQQLDHQNKQIQ
ncbi:hypothetical protein ABPG72_022245 [Tetrahymena utriculariae]